jgi:hypothetical protein
MNHFSLAILQYSHFRYQAPMKRLCLDIYILSTIFTLVGNYLIFFMGFHILGSVDVLNAHFGALVCLL